MKKLLSIIILAITLNACSKAGSDYIGKWQDIKSPKQELDIKANGENFLITYTHPNIWNDKLQTETLPPAVLQDGILNMQSILTTMVIDKSTGELIFQNHHYKKVD